MKVLILFDLDGTITLQETLPIISCELGLYDAIYTLTQDTVKGNIPFIDSFIKRVGILSQAPVSHVKSICNSIQKDAQIVKFIGMYAENCAIITGNLDCWIDSLCNSVCPNWYSSVATVDDDYITKINKIVKKEEIVKEKQAEGYRIVFVGEGNNDAEAMRYSNVAIAYGGVHQPARSVLSIADYVIYSGSALCRLLKRLL